MVTPSLPSHLAMHCRWFSLYCPLGQISLVVKMSTTRMKLCNHCVGLALVTSYWPMPELFNRPGVINKAYPVWFFIVVGFCRTVNTSIEKQGQVAVTVLEKFLKSKLQQNRTSTARQALAFLGLGFSYNWDFFIMHPARPKAGHRRRRWTGEAGLGARIFCTLLICTDKVRKVKITYNL